MAEGRDEASPHRVFLCHRRESAAALAGRLKDRLDGRFAAVFLDATGIPPGSDWPETLELELRRATVLLAVIDSGWLARQRQLRSDSDFVRREIATALHAGIWVIPVLVDGARFADLKVRLPPDLAALPSRQAAELRNSEFEHDVALLVATIRQLPLDPQTGFLPVVPTPVGPPRARRTSRRWYLVASCLLVAVPVVWFASRTPLPPSNPSAAASTSSTVSTAPQPPCALGEQIEVGAGSLDVAAASDASAWVTQPGADRIVHLTCSDGVRPLQTVNGQRPLQHPFAIATAADGTAWFTEGVPVGDEGTGRNRICHVGLDEDITCTLIPTPDSGAVGIAVQAGGTVWFTEQRQDKIGRRGPHGDVTEFALPPQSRPDQIVVAADGGVWFTEFGRNKIGTLRPDGTPGPEYDTTPVGTEPVDLVVTEEDGTRQVWFTHRSGPTIGRLDPESGRLSAVELGPAAPNRSTDHDPTNLAHDSGRGGLWVTEIDHAQVSFLPVRRSADNPLPKRLESGSRPVGVAVTGGGAVWVAEQGEQRVDRFTPF